MGWGNILLTWPRYAGKKPGNYCERCHQNFAADEENCPYCSHMDDQELQVFLREMGAKKKKSSTLLILLVSVLLLYTIIVLFVLPLFLN